MYGILSSGGLVVYDKKVPNSKEMIESKPECPDGYKYSYQWIDTGEQLEQRYSYTPLTEDELREIAAHDMPTRNDYENALSDLGVST